MSGTDPRSRDDGLGWVTRAVFADERVRVSVAVGDSPVPEGVRRVVRFAVVPSVARARFLLPLGRRRVTAASVLAYNALRPPGVRAARAAVGTLVRAGAASIARLPVLSAWVPAHLDSAEVLLTDRLSAALGGSALHAAIGVRPPDPNRKPTLQLFDDAGRPVGFAKIGWNDATRALVRAESSALRALPRWPANANAATEGTAGGGGDYPIVPDLLLAADWAGQAVAVIAPLPPRVRRLDAPRTPRLAAMLAVARRGGSAGRPRPLADSSFHRRLLAEAEAARPVVGRRAYDAVTALIERYGRVVLEFGDWHGDWVSWNLGRHGRRLVAWDWEHSGTDVPVGFDLAHQAFQDALVLGGRPVAIAVGAAADAVHRFADRLGLDREQAAAVVDAYVIELWLRTWRLAAGGAGWHPALHPGLLDVLANRRQGEHR